MVIQLSSLERWLSLLAVYNRKAAAATTTIITTTTTQAENKYKEKLNQSKNWIVEKVSFAYSINYRHSELVSRRSQTHS